MESLAMPLRQGCVQSPMLWLSHPGALLYEAAKEDKTLICRHYCPKKVLGPIKSHKI